MVETADASVALRSHIGAAPMQGDKGLRPEPFGARLTALHRISPVTDAEFRAGPAQCLNISGVETVRRGSTMQSTTLNARDTAVPVT